MASFGGRWPIAEHSEPSGIQYFFQRPLNPQATSMTSRSSAERPGLLA